MTLVLKKTAAVLFTLLLISFLVFLAFSVIPSDAAVARLGTDATKEQLQELRRSLGLEGPLLTRYFTYLKNLFRGDLGESLAYSQIPVRTLIEERLPVTLTLAAGSFLMILAVSLPLSLLCARKDGHVLSRLILDAGQGIMAIPPFFLGILLTYVFGILLKLFRPGEFIWPDEDFGGFLTYMIFPSLTVALPKIAMTVRFLTGALKEELTKDYVRTARAKHLSYAKILYRHVLRGALIPTITFLGLILTEVLAGSLIAEQVFTLPGIGRLLIVGITSRDFPVVGAVILYVTAVVILVSSSLDLIYKWIDPRIRRGQNE